MLVAVPHTVVRLHIAPKDMVPPHNNETAVVAPGVGDNGAWPAAGPWRAAAAAAFGAANGPLRCPRTCPPIAFGAPEHIAAVVGGIADICGALNAVADIVAVHRLCFVQAACLVATERVAVALLFHETRPALSHDIAAALVVMVVLLQHFRLSPA